MRLNNNFTSIQKIKSQCFSFQSSFGNLCIHLRFCLPLNPCQMSPESTNGGVRYNFRRFPALSIDDHYVSVWFPASPLDSGISFEHVQNSHHSLPEWSLRSNSIVFPFWPVWSFFGCFPPSPGHVPGALYMSIIHPLFVRDAACPLCYNLLHFIPIVYRTSPE